MLNVTDNNIDKFEISYNEHFDVNFVCGATYDITVSSTCDISMNTRNVQLGPESSKCFLCLCVCYNNCHHCILIYSYNTYIKILSMS